MIWSVRYRNVVASKTSTNIILKHFFKLKSRFFANTTDVRRILGQICDHFSTAKIYLQPVENIFSRSMSTRTLGTLFKRVLCWIVSASWVKAKRLLKSYNARVSDDLFRFISINFLIFSSLDQLLSCGKIMGNFWDNYQNIRFLKSLHLWIDRLC